MSGLLLKANSGTGTTLEEPTSCGLRKPHSSGSSVGIGLPDAKGFGDFGYLLQLDRGIDNDDCMLKQGFLAIA